ncbi:MAG: NACHT domain-containing protein [Symploca sp. SIO1C4]|uniref:NACHT domain-containing protein n=1 Tax=Symploca sp. SIO1C4 TaxID=2607765 RepID=A0A6B3MZU9_9CYAN|nr:NACHT domain-containing protein [Symploca sp. SIO1C4]
MATLDEIKAILRKIAEKTATKKDFEVLHQVDNEVLQQLDESEERITIQFAKQINNIREGKGNHFGDRTSHAAHTEVAQRPREEQLLLDDVKKDVKGRLSLSLFVQNAKPINLKKELQQELVNCPWTRDIKSSPNFKGLDSEESAVLEIFEHDEIAGKLLIVGEPGAGKTTTLLELMKELIVRAEKHAFAPIPVLINLASWQDKQSICEWMTGVVSVEYGKSVAIVKQWLTEQKLLPMLDGLDELKSSLQEPCIRAINTFLSQENRPSSLVVCSRRKEYINCETRLNLNGAVCLLPLSNEQIQYYLKQIENAPSWQTISQDYILLELVRIPLFLNVSIIACQEKSPENWEKIDSSEERLKYFWNSYVYQRLTNEARSEQMLIWLTWIAQQLTQEAQEQESQKVGFVVSQLQPYRNLDRNQKKIYIVFIFIIILSIIKLVLYLRSGLNIEQGQNLLPQLTILIILVVLIKFSDVIQPIEKIFSSSRIAISSIASALIVGLISGLYYKLTFLYYNSGVSLIYIFIITTTIIITPFVLVFLALAFLGRYTWTWFYITPFLFLIASLLYSSLIDYFFGNTEQILYVGIISGLTFGQIIQAVLTRITYKGSAILTVERSTHSNQAIRNSFVNASIIGITIGLIIGLIKDFPQGVSIGLIFWLISGGVACIQYFTLRLILYWKGYIPWDYTEFLNYATERTLFQRIGGSYKFIHRLLQEHLVKKNL